jgi:RNA-binding protein
MHITFFQRSCRINHLSIKPHLFSHKLHIYRCSQLIVYAEIPHLTSGEKKKFRADAHRLTSANKLTTINLGQKGITLPFIQGAEAAIKANQLIKIRVNGNCDEDDIVKQLCGKLSAAVVQQIGSTVTLYRPPPQRPSNNKKSTKNKKANDSDNEDEDGNDSSSLTDDVSGIEGDGGGEGVAIRQVDRKMKMKDGRPAVLPPSYMLQENDDEMNDNEEEEGKDNDNDNEVEEEDDEDTLEKEAASDFYTLPAKGGKPGIKKKKPPEFTIL